MARTITAEAAFKTVARAAERIKNDEPARVGAMSPGDVVRQGDIYVMLLDREIDGGKPSGSRQLAPGSSQGSRHVASGDCDVLTVPEREAVAAMNRLAPSTKGQPLFIGPMIVARGPVTLEHPEHGHRTIEGDSAYLVTYQRTWANEVRRALD